MAVSVGAALLVSVVVLDEVVDVSSAFLVQPIALARATVRTAIRKRAVSFLVTWLTSFRQFNFSTGSTLTLEFPSVRTAARWRLRSARITFFEAAALGPAIREAGSG